MPILLQGIEFRDPERARRNAERIQGAIPPDVQQRIQVLLYRSADPDGALSRLETLHRTLPGAFERLLRTTVGLQYVITVFSYSNFLSDEVLQNPEWLEDLLWSGEVERTLTPEELVERLEAFLNSFEEEKPLALALALFRRKQILRVVLRDVLGLATLSEVTAELSGIADAVLEVSQQRILADLKRRYGTPRYRTEDGARPECRFTVLGLGKLGGGELNYSSDIDLMFLYSAAGQTDGPSPITSKEFFKKVSNQLTELLSTYTSEGMCYRVDLRLRPDGRLGEVCISLDGAEAYYRTRARDWELQMLIKARVAAGDRDLGARLLEFVQPLIYSTTLDFSAVEEVSATRERISEKLAAKKGTTGRDVKLARGGIRDIEFLVQCLQRMHGGREPWVRHGGTMLALYRLQDKDLLSPTEFSRLASAYEFLRSLEHRLQFEDDRQVHTLPTASEALELLARRMPVGEIGNDASAERLLRELNTHLEEVQEIYERVIHAQKPMYYTMSTPEAREASTLEELPPEAVAPPSNLIRFLDERAPGLAATVLRTPLRRGHRYLELFLEKVVSRPEWLGWLNHDSVLAGYVLDLFENSPYLAEQLLRRPELIEDLYDLRRRPGATRNYADMAATIGDAIELRRLFRREMFRLQCESICLRAPIFPTLEKTSALADAAIALAYRMAVAQVSVARPPSAGYTVAGQMHVIALGRLGMHEFDLGSDADLVFALPDEDAGEVVFWTRVAERTIDLLTAYTGDGVMFAVDTRLRPEGRSGPLVQLESSYTDYFARRAEAWEGISYMKSRSIAGDPERCTRFLNELQRLDWRRYGQSGRSRSELRNMRQRLEKEQAAANPLKAARGAYYDIDFALMYLRLKGGGIFYKVLNTPARIDVIEQMGHLERADAGFLHDAATLYRAVDHGLRVSTGHAGGDLPNSPSHLEMLTELVSRWTPDHLHDQPIEIEMAQIRDRTREFFDRVFGP
ncbi:MAG: glutamine-synthetase adenylyltransferase [Acidobacteria bacterium]|nr:glutamine-synthetase adenylyltransferase [Acidobacteriota bacterium]